MHKREKCSGSVGKDQLLATYKDADRKERGQCVGTSITLMQGIENMEAGPLRRGSKGV